MSAPVDVLAVLDNFIDPESAPHQPHDLREARAAVAELIEAAKHCEDLLMCYSIDRVDGDEIAETALKVLRSALVRAKGESV